MSFQATADDANLLLRLYELRREPRMRQARDWFMKEFKAETLEEMEKACPMGSEENASFRMVTSYWEMVASFVVSGALNKELFFQSGGELLLCYVKASGMMALYREMMKNPKLMQNIELVAREYFAYYEAEAPGFEQTYRKRIATFTAKK